MYYSSCRRGDFDTRKWKISHMQTLLHVNHLLNKFLSHRCAIGIRSRARLRDSAPVKYRSPTYGLFIDPFERPIADRQPLVASL